MSRLKCAYLQYLFLTIKATIILYLRDCWCVAFGNSYNDEERCVLAGYDNGDIKLFDLRFNKVV